MAMSQKDDLARQVTPIM